MTPVAEWFFDPMSLPQGIVLMLAARPLFDVAVWIGAVLYGLLKAMTE